MNAPQKKSSNWRLFFRIFGLGLGILFITYWIGRLGIRDILEKVFDLDWWLVPLMLNSLLWYVLYTQAWRVYFANLTHKIPFLHLLKIKICGEAVNFVTPLGFVAGDPVRVMMLQKQLGPSTRLGSVIVDRIIHSLASVVFVFSGIVLTIVYMKDILGYSRWFLVAFYLLIIGFLSYSVYELVRGRGVQFLHPILEKLGLTKRFPKLETWIRDLNMELSDFSGGSLGFLLLSFVYHFGGRALGAVEISIIFLYLGGHPQIIYSIILASLTTVIHLIFAFVPGGLGLVEALYGAFFHLQGYKPELGVSMQLIRRLRSLLWVLIAMALLSSHGSVLKFLGRKEKKPIEQKT